MFTEQQLEALRWQIIEGIVKGHELGGLKREQAIEVAAKWDRHIEVVADQTEPPATRE